MSNHRIHITNRLGESFDTFEDILPQSRTKILIVGKVPSPNSVAVGHYFQGVQGKGFWERLREYQLFNAPIGIHDDIGEDDYLIQWSYGITDIIKKPRAAGNNPTSAEYKDGTKELLKKIENYKPNVLLFTYKGALDNVLRYYFERHLHTQYGFNEELNNMFFGCRVFAFPMNGTPATREVISDTMSELKDYIFSLRDI